MKRSFLIILYTITFVFAEQIEVFETSRDFSKTVSFGKSTPSPVVATVHIKKAGSLQYAVSIDSVNNNPWWQSLDVSFGGGCYTDISSQDIGNLPVTGRSYVYNILPSNPYTLNLSSHVNPENDYYGTATCRLIYVACPSSSYCSKYKCPACDIEYCVTHDVHITANYTHGTTVHLHCTNSQTLANDWVAGCQGHCDECGQTYCKLCRHVCGDNVCPNLNGCNQVTCPECGGVYCQKHNFHICGKYTVLSENTGNDNISVQTTITGEAQVAVNITDNSQPTDLTNVESSLNQIAASLGTINNNVIDMSANVISIDSNLTQLNTYLPNQLSGMNTNILGVKESMDNAVIKLNDIDTNLNSTNSNLESINSNINEMSENLNDTINQSNTKLEKIYDKLDNLDFDGELNVDLGGLGGKIDSTNTKLDTIINGNGNLGLGSVGTASPASGVGSELVENELTGKEIENVQKVEYFTAIKNKLLPPRLEIGSYDACFSFDIPTVFGEPLHLTLDFNDEKLRAVRLAVRNFSSVLMILVFMFGILRMVRQY